MKDYIGFIFVAILALLVAMFAALEKLKDHEQRIKALEMKR